MGQSPLTGTDGSSPGPILSIPAGWVDEHPAGFLVVRAAHQEDSSRVRRVAPGRIVWIEAPLSIAEEDWPPGVGLDVMVTDPGHEGAKLHGLSRLRSDRPIRVTIPVAPGVGRAARIAMALQLPIRLLPRQPQPEAVQEMLSVFEAYLHDPQANASVQPFDAALAFLLHGQPVTAWTALDLDPAFVCRVPDRDEEPAGIPADPNFVDAWATRLVESGAECADCPFVRWCAGFFKWPDPSYACQAVKPVLAAVGDAAEAIARDLDEAKALSP